MARDLQFATKINRVNNTHTHTHISARNGAACMYERLSRKGKKERVSLNADAKVIVVRPRAARES